jgi:RNase P subunit RPR2
VKDHILSEAVARHNGLLEQCMYCNDPFNSEDKWKVAPVGFSTYISVTCSSCSREHRFKDSTIHTLDDLLEKLKQRH